MAMDSHLHLNRINTGRRLRSVSSSTTVLSRRRLTGADQWIASSW